MNTVSENTAEQRFEMSVGPAIAYISFHREANAVSLDHTQVPDELGGRGVGTALVRGTLDLLASEHRKIIPRCSFVVRFIEKNPEYRTLLARD